MQSVAALLTGLFLLFIARKQSAANNELILTAENEPNRYGRVSRLLHWTIAILFISLIPMGIFASMIPEDTDYRKAYYVVHKTIGVTVFLLVLARLVWNRVSKRPALDSSITPIERKLAHGAHYTLYFMMLAIPITGFMMTSYHGKSTYFFFLGVGAFMGAKRSLSIMGRFSQISIALSRLYCFGRAHIRGS